MSSDTPSAFGQTPATPQTPSSTARELDVLGTPTDYKPRPQEKPPALPEDAVKQLANAVTAQTQIKKQMAPPVPDIYPGAYPSGKPRYDNIRARLTK